MSSKSIFLMVILGAIACSGSPVVRDNCNNGGGGTYTDRLCGQDLTKLWLDIVIVVDNSKGMTNRGLQAVSADISSIFVDGLQLGISSSEPRTTRVAIVTYNSAATVAADFNQFKSLDDLTTSVYTILNKVSDVSISYLQTGLEAAEELLEKQSFNTDRDHYRKLVIVYASDYKGTGTNDPLPISRRLKESDISIATVAYGQDNDDSFLNKLAQIATPGFSYSNKDNLVGELRTCMLQVNCYCPNGWYQMRQSFANPNSFRYGVCMIPVTIQATWTAAKMACRNYWKNGFLVNEYTQTKHDYVLEVVKNNTMFTQPYTYLIGLSYTSGNWYWEQPAGQPTLLLQNWNDWNPQFPTSSSTKTVGVAVQFSSAATTGWQNTERSDSEKYVCETASCDSTNYCEKDED